MKRELFFKKGRSGISIPHTDILEYVDMWLHSIGAGDWVLKLERKQTQRSLSQNSLMWIWFDVIAKEWSEATDKYYSRDGVKDYFCRKYLPMELPNGEVVGGSTSILTTEQMTEFLDKVQAYAATEWGITLLSQEDKMFNEWRSQYE